MVMAVMTEPKNKRLKSYLFRVMKECDLWIFGRRPMKAPLGRRRFGFCSSSFALRTLLGTLAVVEEALFSVDVVAKNAQRKDAVPQT